MCGPAFCAYRISQDVNALAKDSELVALGQPTQLSSEEVRKGLEDKAQEFRESGSALYRPLSP